MATPTPKPVTISVPQAGRDYLGLGKNAAYQAAARGEIPVLKFGGKLRVPVVALKRLLENAGTQPRDTSLAFSPSSGADSGANTTSALSKKSGNQGLSRRRGRSIRPVPPKSTASSG